MTAANGVATFGGCAVNQAGTYTLDATKAGLTTGTSGSFTISAAAANQLSYTQQPSSANAGATLGTIKVAILDSFGNQTSATSSVTLAIKAGTGDPPRRSPAPPPSPPSPASRPSAASRSTRPPPATSCTQPTARSPPPTARRSRSAPPPRDQLSYTQQPAIRERGCDVGDDQGRHPRFVRQPDERNLERDPRDQSRDRRPGRDALRHHHCRRVAGVATFSGLSIDKAAAGYQLHATDGALTAADSSAFTISAAAADHLSYTQQPASANAGATLGTIKVAILDSFGNQTSATSNVTLAIKAGTGDPAATLSGTTTVAAVAGVATFSGLSIDKAAAGYQLHATDGALTAADSNALTISPAAADHLTYTQQPPAPTQARRWGRSRSRSSIRSATRRARPQA